jgi:hypothetical protein
LVPEVTGSQDVSQQFPRWIFGIRKMMTFHQFEGTIYSDKAIFQLSCRIFRDMCSIPRPIL